MKKNILLSLTIIVLALSVTIQSCKKDDIDKNNEDNKEVNNMQNIDNKYFECINGINVKLDNSYDFGERNASEWLYFETRNDYTNAIEQLSSDVDDAISSFESALSFSSMRVSKTEKQRESINIDDDVLASLLNNEGRIRIGEYVFQIDASNDMLLVYSTDGSAKVQCFSTDDNVFDILDGTDTKNRSRGCDAKNKLKDIYFNGSYIDCKVVYQKAGIYFSLLSKISENVYGGSNSLHLYCNGFGNNDNYFVKNNESIVNTIEPYSVSGYDKSYKYRPYQGIKRLERFHFSTYFNVTDDVNHRELGTFSLRIDCGA